MHHHKPNTWRTTPTRKLTHCLRPCRRDEIRARKKQERKPQDRHRGRQANCIANAKLTKGEPPKWKKEKTRREWKTQRPRVGETNTISERYTGNTAAHNIKTAEKEEATWTSITNIDRDEEMIRMVENSDRCSENFKDSSARYKLPSEFRANSSLS